MSWPEWRECTRRDGQSGAERKATRMAVAVDVPLKADGSGSLRDDARLTGVKMRRIFARHQGGIDDHSLLFEEIPTQGTGKKTSRLARVILALSLRWQAPKPTRLLDT